MILEIRRALGAAAFRRAYRMLEAGLFVIVAAGFLAGILALACWILEVSKRP